MTTLPLGTILVARQVAARELASALPDAPVVAHRTRQVRTLRRTRRLTAGALVRAAARISPA